MIGTYALSAGYYDAYYGQAQQVRTLIRRDFAAARSSACDVAARCRPRRRSRSRSATRSTTRSRCTLNDVFTLPVNLAGLPGLSVPCGLSEGLPIGPADHRPGVRREPPAPIGHAMERALEFDPIPGRLKERQS